MSNIEAVGAWVADNAIWLIPAILGSIAGWKKREGTKIEKAWDIGVEVHEQAKREHWDKVVESLGNEAEDSLALIPEWRRKIEESEAKLLALRKPKKKAKPES